MHLIEGRSEERPALSLVVAMAENAVIGRDKALPWRLPADLAHFKRLTLDKPILMGRKTWESLPGLLPRRRHLILSRDRHYRVDGGEVLASLEEALAATAGEPELMVVGGAALYAQTLPIASRLYLTLVHACVAGDTRFPDWDPAEWRELSRVDHAADAHNGFDMTFLELHRIP